MRPFLVAVAGVSLGVSGAAVAQSLTLIQPTPGGTDARTFGISADGATATGYSLGNLQVAFTWTAADGRNDVGYDASMPGKSAAQAISGDGQTIAGRAFDGNDPPIAFRWRGPGTFESLGTLPGTVQSRAFGVSGDGEVVVGRADTAGSVSLAFRWTPTEGMTNLGVARPGDFYSDARAVSRNGAAIVGTSTGSTTSTAYVWTSTTGMTLLPALPGRTSSGALGINHDATIVVGSSSVNAGGQGLLDNAVMWVNGVAVDLGLAPGSNRSYALAVNDTGSVVVGQVLLANFDTVAAIWTPETGMMTLASYLTGIGVTIPQGVSLLEATGVSADGRTIVGYTGLPGQVRQGFVATIPAPATGALLALGLTATLRRRR